MGGWYAPAGLYVPRELGGLSIDKFCEAARAEGCPLNPVPNFPLHMHPLFRDADIYGHGKPTVIAHASRDVRQGPGSLPACEAARQRVFMIPWFKHFRKRAIDQYVAAVRKVAVEAASGRFTNASELRTKRQDAASTAGVRA
jgi:dTDP-4-amino-4,6-dideoxygalactose transaminase